MLRLHAIVHGKVQGVNFRSATAKAARELSISGWVRNTEDGSVEVVAEGLVQNLQALLEFLHEGPSGAEVTSVDETWFEADGSFDDFAIRYV